MFTLTIKTTTDAFAEFPERAVADALRKVISKLEDGYTTARIFDDNGNTVGSFRLDIEEDEED